MAHERGLILVDTKYEFGTDENGTIILADEIHTPDSSRYWLADTTAMLFGFCLAARLPVRASLALALAAELFTGLMIRDNLTLNVVQLIVPSKAISAWQAEGGLYSASTTE